MKELVENSLPAFNYAHNHALFSFVLCRH